MARHHITAIIYSRKGDVLSIGQNSYVKTHPLQTNHAEKVGLSCKQFLHAEVHAITKCKRLDKAYRISIFRYSKTGEPMNAKPCPVCMSAIAATNIKVIEHT